MDTDEEPAGSESLKVKDPISSFLGALARLGGSFLFPSSIFFIHQFFPQIQGRPPIFEECRCEPR